MPVTRPIVLAKQGTGGNATFNLLKTLSDGSQYLEDASTTAAPWFMTIRHSSSVHKQYGTVDQHLVQNIRWILTASGVLMPLITNLTIRLPRDAAFTYNIQSDSACMPGKLIDDNEERVAVLLGYS